MGSHLRGNDGYLLQSIITDWFRSSPFRNLQPIEDAVP